MKPLEMPEEEVARYWDENAKLWADHVRKGWDAYREYFNNPAFFEFIGDRTGNVKPNSLLEGRKHMSTSVYYEILSQAQRLTPADQLRLLEELAVFVRRQITPQRRRSILELQGLGKEIWLGIDVQQYIDQERASWNG